jgi:16S rRNA (cytidine1402-2'-O)-methyltransferase
LSGPALVLVGTPIGNLADLSPRARDELTRADVIACEDTRRAGRLLELSGIGRKPLLVINDHTEASRVRDVVERIGRGERVAVITDAGMPGISDPGERLVRAVAEAGHRVELVPGPSAVVSALVVSGLPTGRFSFEGFLPRSGTARTARLAAVAAESRTVVLYEAPHRVRATIDDLTIACGPDRRVVLAREMTKLHEEVWRGKLGDAQHHLSARAPRGEYAIVLDGAPEPAEVDDDAIRAAIDRERAAGASTKDAVASVAAIFGVSRRRVYDLATGAILEAEDPSSRHQPTRDER